MYYIQALILNTFVLELENLSVSLAYLLKSTTHPRKMIAAYNIFRKNLTDLATPLMILFLSILSVHTYGQDIIQRGNVPDQGTLRLLKPDYKTPYGTTKPNDVKATLDHIYSYLAEFTPYQLVDKDTKAVILDLSKADSKSIFKRGDFNLLHYTWAVTYTGMLEVGAATLDKKYTDYALNRINFIAKVADKYRTISPSDPNPVKPILDPKTLDEVGAMTAAMAKASNNTSTTPELRPVIDNFKDFIMKKQYRFKDGTIGRNKPFPNSLWLDDLYMSVPALMQLGILTKDTKYFDEAARQYLQFSERMFKHTTGLFMHGWVQDMSPHPEFNWGRANGWAILAETTLLDDLPENHPSRSKILSLYREHVNGLAKLQHGSGLWHQLLDKNDSYLETSGSAAFAYGITRGINNGWLDAKAYGPQALLAWNALSTKVTANGEIEDTCVGTGLAFDPAYYYNRPVSNFAAHSYGIVLLAGAEAYRFLQKYSYDTSDTSIMRFK